jgi:hypothetical protein
MGKRQKMTTIAGQTRYHSTESKYKGGADEMYVTYDLEQKTRGKETTEFPKIQRVYIAGKVKRWKTGKLTTRTGRKVNGVAVEYEQSRSGYRRKAFTAKRGNTTYRVAPTTVKGTSQSFTKVVEVPKQARNVHFYTTANSLPQKYRSALQSVR